jgi:predicted dehydrogenase
MKKVRIGLIGLGVMASEHVKQLLQIEGVTITAICDRESDRVLEWGLRYQIEQQSRYTEYEALITDPNVDAILSVTPNDAHYDIIRLCLIHGKPIMTEKPFTRTYAEAKALLELSETHSSACMVGFSYRYVPSFRMARDMIRNGKIGKIRHVFIQYLQQWGGPLFEIPMNWRWDKSVTGTGVLADLGSHMIDSARFLVAEPLEVSALMASFISQRKEPVSGKLVDVDIDDFAAFTAVLEQGIPAVCQTSRNAYGCGNQLEVSVYGDIGSLHMGCEYGDSLTWVHANEERSQVREKITVPDRYRLKQMQDFVDLVRGTVREETATLRDGYLNQRAMEAIELASLDRKTISIEDISKSLKSNEVKI